MLKNYVFSEQEHSRETSSSNVDDRCARFYKIIVFLYETNLVAGRYGYFYVSQYHPNLSRNNSGT